LGPAPPPSSDQTLDLAQTIAQLARQDRGKLLAVLISKYRSFDLAEDALQEALSSAYIHWGRFGLPANPQGWLLTVASRKVIDRLRQSSRDAKVAADIIALAAEETDERPDIPDERLRLIFTCCHPALEEKSRIALTLRTLGGLTTPEIAKAFLDAETTMGQRLSRAKAKILNAGIPYAVPGPEQWAERLNSVLTVIYLIFNEGYFASTGEVPLRQSLCDEAIYLGRMVNSLRPEEPEVLGLLALMLCTNARRRARLAGSSVIPLEAQDHLLWDAPHLAEAERLLDHAMTLRAPGPFQIQAAIAALHSQSGPRDWHQIVLLYDSLLRMDFNPVIRLNRAVALAELGHLESALTELSLLASPLAAYQPFHAANADLLSKAGRTSDALVAYDRAIVMAATPSDAAFLKSRRDKQMAG
jgi:RNA polymerase sigma factor (sigma-70 family)